MTFVHIRLGAAKVCALALLFSLLSVAAFSAAHAQPAQDAEPVAEVPYRIAYQGWFTVQGAVNGSGPYDFIVDSGATITSVFANLAAQQNFQPTEGRMIELLGLSGAKELPAYFLGDIDFPGVALKDQVGVILPDWTPPNTPPQGVLGLDLLSRYAVQIDPKDMTIRFYDPSIELKRTRGWTKVKLSPLEGNGAASKLYTVTIKVRAAYIPCIVDLGASGTIFNTSALESMLAAPRSGLLLRRNFSASRINDVFDISDSGKPISIERLRIGKATWRNQIFLVYDAQIFNDLGYENKPFCLVGADMFADRSVIFDFAREELYIGPAR